MPSLCQNLKTNYDRLQTLTLEFVPQYAAVKASGDLTKIKRLKKKLEQARDALREHLLVFVVPDSLNPYREALKEAGLSGPATAEKKEVTINIPEEISTQCAVYAEVKDASGKPVLQDWVSDISNNKHLLFAEVAKDYEKIQERIKAGMVPTVMPSRSVQETTWEVAMTNLKPIWIDSVKSKLKMKVNDSYLYDKYGTEKMNQANFFKDIPDRPYLLWTKPSQKSDAETFNKTFDDQKKYQAKLVVDHPNLYDPKDIIPTEYSAVLSNASHAVLERYKQIIGGGEEPSVLKPLDYYTYTRFLSAGLFSVGNVPRAYFYPDSSGPRVNFGRGDSAADNDRGFRPVGRS